MSSFLSKDHIGRRSVGERAPKLLFVVTVSWYFVSHRLALAEAAVRAGYEVHLATRITDRDHLVQISKSGISVHSLEIGRGNTGALYDLRSVMSLYRLYRRIRPDIVHHVAMKPIVFGGIAARMAGDPAVVHAVAGMGYAYIATGRKARLRRYLLAALLRVAIKRQDTVVIVQNADDFKGMVNAGIVSGDQIRIIRGSGVDTRAVHPDPEPPLPIRVMLPARMLREKGVMEFCEAAKRLRQEGVDAEFILAGMIDPANPGALSARELDAITQRTGVSYLGFVADMSALYGSCHIVCLPSYREGLPKALIEAAAAARPIVTTDVPGCRDVVRNGVNGALVAPRSVEGLKEALRELIEDADLRSQYGVAGRRLAETEFDLHLIVDQILDVYSSVLRSEL